VSAQARRPVGQRISAAASTGAASGYRAFSPLRLALGRNKQLSDCATAIFSVNAARWNIERQDVEGISKLRIGWIIVRSEIAMFRLCYVVLPAILSLSLSLFGQEVQTKDSLDEEILHVMESLDSQYSYQINQHFDSPPKEPEISQESFPRYNDLALRLKSALRKHRLFLLYQAPTVIQRVSSTYVLAGPFYGTAAGLGFCDDDVCRYSGSIFVRLRSPSVGDNLTPGIALQYAGLKNYITVTGAPETIPEFSQADLDQFADVRGLRVSLATFHPTPEETAKYVLPAQRGRQQQLNAWALDGIRMEQSYLQKRLKLIRALTTPLIGARTIKYLSPYGMLPQNISREMQQSLPILLREYEGNVTRLLDEISLIEATGDAYPSASGIPMSEYTQGWIALSWQNPSDFPTPASMPWGELQSWTHFPIPSLAADGTPVQPPWWAEFKSLHQGHE
jgi:hypothetical protein